MRRIGLCLPQSNQVLWGLRQVVSQGIFWQSVTQSLGEGAGHEPGELLFPLSFDAVPDGRFFVLDAGNGRIQVFDGEGQYLTQWGRRGSGQGEFDFGRGQVAEDFAGSVVVDEEGFVYVADVGNRRIQKFAP